MIFIIMSEWAMKAGGYEKIYITYTNRNRVKPLSLMDYAESVFTYKNGNIEWIKCRGDAVTYTAEELTYLALTATMI